MLGSGKIKLELAQYRELAAFSQFGSDLDKDTQMRLAHGERLMEILKQKQYAPMAVENQVMIIYAVVNKHLMDVPVSEFARCEAEFLKYMEEQHAEIGKDIKAQGVVTDETEEGLKSAIEAFLKTFDYEV